MSNTKCNKKIDFINQNHDLSSDYYEKLVHDLKKSNNYKDISLNVSEQLSSPASPDVSLQTDTTHMTSTVNYSNLSSSDGLSRGNPYTNSYLDSFAIDINDAQRDNIFFLPDQPIHVQIIGHEEQPSMVVLHTKVYTINIRHADYNWTIKRRYKNFLKLYEAYALFKTKLNIKNVAASAHLTSTASPTATTPNSIIFNNNLMNDNLNTNFSNTSTFKPTDHFKLIFQSIVSDFSRAKNILEKFLKDVVDNKIFRNHTETLKFLEVSHLSFISELGDKNKEGLLKYRTVNFNCCCFPLNFSFFWDSKWLVIKDTWVACLDPKTGRINTVLLVDQVFRVSNGVVDTGVKNGLLIENLSKSLLLKCYNEKRAQEWRFSVLQMIYTSGKLFASKQPHNSFAPPRENSLVKWFVDGSDYMESIADSIEAAKEEIFITAFFLSPEIYLKRPVVVGDKWRLDKLLKRKAEEGVKIYVLIYKEIEMTLPNNSAYSKRILALSHKNIKVLRYPDHLNEPNQFFTIMWAHHEKLVIIDQSVAYFGGVDLCFGRWDNHLHKLTDLGSVLPSKPNHKPQIPISGSIDSMSTLAMNQDKNPIRLLEYKPTPKNLTVLVNNDLKEGPELETKSNANQPTSGLLNTEHSKLNYNTIENSKSQTVLRDKNNNNFDDLNQIPYQHKSDLDDTDTEINSNLNKHGPHPVYRNDDSLLRTKLKKIRAMKVLSSPPLCPINNYKVDTDDEDENHLSNKSASYLEAKRLYNLLDDSDDNLNRSNSRRIGNTFDKLFKSHLKRSKSLEIERSDAKSTVTYENNNYYQNPANLPNRDSLNQRFKMLKDSLNSKLKSNSQCFKFTDDENDTNGMTDNTEPSLLGRLKRIKQLKDNLKRYTLNKLNNNDNSSEFNSSFDQYDDEVNKSFQPSPSEQILNYLQGSTKYWIGKDYCNFIYKDVYDVQSPFQDSIDRTLIPRMPWHDVAGCVCGPAARDFARHFIQRWNYVKSKKVRNNKNYVFLIPKSYKSYTIPRQLVSNSSTCKTQVLRSVSSWSAGIAKTESSIHEAMKHYIRTSKHYVYIENQYFVSLIENDSVVRNEINQCLYERIVQAAKLKETFKVYVFLPLIPGYEGEYGRSSGVLLHAITHFNNSSINGLIKKLSESSIEALNYVCFFSLRTWSELNNKLVTELIYVHSKLMIVDDRVCIIGSANINDRSLLGNRDSETALLIEDTQFVNGVINKKPCQVGRFASTLRQRLFKEFLGEFPNTPPSVLNSTLSMPAMSSVNINNLVNRKSLLTQALHAANSHNHSFLNDDHSHTSAQPSLDVTDPCSDDFYKQVMLKHAAQNTKIFDKVFKVIPCDFVGNFDQLKEYQKTPSLNQTASKETVRVELNKIKGYIVLYPNRFLCHEDLTPPLGTKEKLLPTILFT